MTVVAPFVALIAFFLRLGTPVLGSMAHGPALVQARTSSATSVALQKKTVQERSTSGTATVHKLAYFGKVKVGSPAQEFTVVFDTGSGNLIIPGSDCDSKACQKHEQFRSQASSTVQAVNCDGTPPSPLTEPDEVTITFGTGSIQGRCLQDRICIGGEDVCEMGNFISATQESDSPFASFKFDGVLGLGREILAQTPDFSMMGRLQRQHTLKIPLFSVFLSDSDAEVSEISFGEIQRHHMASELFWVNVSGDSGYWEVHMEDIVLNGKKQSLGSSRIAVDTGTSELAGPSDLVIQLEKLLHVNANCSNYDQLPELGFLIGGHVLHLSPSNYVSKDRIFGCRVALMSLDVPPPKGPLFVFGIPFLQRYFTVYDHENSKVGFAVARHAGEEPEKLLNLAELGSARAGGRRSWRPQVYRGEDF